MKQTIAILLSLLCLSTFGTEISTQDSLLQLLTRTYDPIQKATIYRNLADINFESPQERIYLKLLINEIKASNSEMLLDAYTDLTYSYIKANESDSASLQLDLIKKMVPNDATLCYLNILLFNSKIVKTDAADAINEESRRQADKGDDDKNIFHQIEHSYNIANALETTKKYSDAIPYINTAVKLAATLPFKEAGLLYITTLRLQIRILQLDGQYTVITPLIEQLAELQESYYQKYLKENRPFYPINGLRISSYIPLIINIRHISPEKATYYLQKIVDLSNKSNRPIDKYRGFLAINNYHLFKKDYNKALTANDSLIKYAPIVAPYLLPYLHNVNSQIYEAIGDYKQALQSLKTSTSLQDSTSAKKATEQINELQVKYDLNKLNYEKSQLEIKNKLILLISLSIILLISFLISIYLYQNLKKEKAMKRHLRTLKTKAEESEKMKTAFINSICHEIRTPLNSIVGFTDLIFDSSIDEESRKSFPEQIQKNTHQLTSLINSMLEVSNLDVSDEKLPCTQTDINTLCQREIDLTKELSPNPNIMFHLNIPKTPSVIATNEQYLSLVVENLLNNAIKFTQNGIVTLEYHEDKVSNQLQLTVTDTGSGIPLDKQEEVFERFVKLNSFIPGNGLGLYLCRVIVKRLSGEIRIDPNYTQGARVVVLLPLEDHS